MIWPLTFRRFAILGGQDGLDCLAGTPQKDKMTKVAAILAKHGTSRDACIKILQEIQHTYGYLAPEALRYLTEHTPITKRQIYGVATFYEWFRFKPTGRHLVRACHGTACHVNGAKHTTRAAEETLKIKDKETTGRSVHARDGGLSRLLQFGAGPDDRGGGAWAADAHPGPQIAQGLPAEGETRSTTGVTGNLMSTLASNSHWRIAVGLGSCGAAAGAVALYERLQQRADPARVLVQKTGCAGLCHREPMLELYSPSGEHWTYVHLTADAVDQILDLHIGRNQPVDNFLLGGADRAQAVDQFLSKQQKIVLENCGAIDPDSLKAYVVTGGYQALRQVLKEMTPAQVIATVTASGLRGRGGAGFPTGVKWKFAAEAQGAQKYFIANGDEGDPGAFMDRSVMESDPHRVLEGMVIARLRGWGVGRGISMSAPSIRWRLSAWSRPLIQARAAGLLGPKILGSRLLCELHVREGPGRLSAARKPR